MTLVRRCLAAALSVFVAAAVVVGLPALPGTVPAAEAAEASLFDPSNIVSDTVFYDSGAMTQGEVQAFLEQRGRNCVAGEQPCLKDYRSDSRTWPAEAGLCRGYTGRAQESVASIIVGVAQSCGISPRVLLVLLEKEQALVGRTRPTSRAYQIAMGFGCPDTAPCNAEYYGFFNQTYRAARQFKVYQNNPTRYGYQAGRTNYIQWHPNASCGGTNVRIQNQATAGLYIYTPYQPNAAAMRNLYGTGDSCSSYGNRNFWRLFTDWFGDPRAGGSFVRTAGDPTVWLVNGANRYRVPDMGVLGAFSNLGSLAYVSEAYVARLQEGPPLRNVVLEPQSGGVFFVDANIALQMTTCGQVADFGASCSSLPTISSYQLQSLTRGPAMTNGYETTDGRRWFVQGGTKREVFDDAALVANGLSLPSVRLTAQGLASIPVGVPVLPQRGVVVERGTTTAWLWSDGRRHEIPLAAVDGQPTLAALPRSTMDGTSISTLAPGLHMTGVVIGSDGRRYLLTTTGLAPLAAPSTVTSIAPSWSASLISSFPVDQPVAETAFIRASSSPTVHHVRSTQLRPVSTWNDLVLMAGSASEPRVHVVPDAFLTTLGSIGAVALPPGILAKSSASPDVYYATDANTVVHVDDLSVARAVGATNIRTVPAAALSAGTRVPGYLSPLVRCASGVFIAVGGRLQSVDVQAQRGLPVTPLGQQACAALPRAAGAAAPPVLLKTGSGPELYLVTEGRRQHLQSWAAVLRSTGGAEPTIVVVGRATLAGIPQGAPIA